MRWVFRHAIAFLAVAGWLGHAPVSRAHQPGLSSLSVELGTNQLSARLILAWQEIETIVPLDRDQDRTLSADELTAARAPLTRLAEGALDLVSDGRMLALKKPPEITRDEADATGVRFHLVYEFPPTRVLTVTAEIIASLRPGHRQIVSIRSSNNVELGTAILVHDQPSVDVPLFAIKEKPAATAAKMRSFRQYLLLGIEHIVTGWDHLAFLFGLLVIGGKVRDAVKIITSFTLAHSLTLALTTFNVLRIPSNMVEALIAASIIYVGFENMVRDNFRQRWMLTFAFGLVHGCGFASVLRELEVGANGTGIVKPLVSFNLGVELGQLAIAAVLLPLIWKLKPVFPKRWVPVTSIGLIVVGSYFLIPRLWP